MIQKGDIWYEEDGSKVQHKRVTALERWQETNAMRCLKRAKKVESDLLELKKFLAEVAGEAYGRFLKENDTEHQKEKKIDTGGINFDVK